MLTTPHCTLLVPFPAADNLNQTIIVEAPAFSKGEGLQRLRLIFPSFSELVYDPVRCALSGGWGASSVYLQLERAHAHLWLAELPHRPAQLCVLHLPAHALNLSTAAAA